MSSPGPAHRLSRPVAVFAAVLIGLHGLVHLMGVALLWRLGEPGSLTYADAVPAAGTTGGYLVGAGWLLAGAGLVTAAWLLATDRPAWRAVAAGGAVLSILVIGLSPGLTAAGLVADAAVLVLVAVTWTAARGRAPRRTS